MLCLYSKPYNSFSFYLEKNQSHCNSLQGPTLVVLQLGCILDSTEGTLNNIDACIPPQETDLIYPGCSLELGIVKSFLNLMIIMCSQG